MTDQLDRLKAALADRYTLERELGAGGMATVYLAADLKHERKVAIKVLRPELAAVLGAERFVQEIKTTANLQHPNILPLFDSGEADGFLYYVMPYVEGETLRVKLNRETQLGVDEAVKLTTEVADALEYAHQQGVIHRDIKPENILLHAGRPLVADFGIALAVSAAAGGRMTETGLSLGTPHYMSPEQATAEKQITARSDIYSLGAVLYEMLTGDPPHTGSSAQAIILKIVSEEVVPVTKRRRAVPANVAAAVAQALEKLPADRFESAHEFATALANPAFAVATQAGLRAAGTAATPWNALSRMLAVVSAVLLAVTAWTLLRSSAGPTLASYDVGLPDSAPMLTDLHTQLSVSPAGDFLVYVAVRDGRTLLWRRSLYDGDALPIPGTDGARLVAVSPTGNRVAFIAADGTANVIPLEGGTAATLVDIGNPTAIQWVSDARVLFAGGDGAYVHVMELDGSGATRYETPYCINPLQLPDGMQVMCGGGGQQYAYVIDLRDSSRFFLRTAGMAGSDTTEYLRGTQFRLLGGRYLLYMSVEGDLRAVPFDPRTRRVGRAATVLKGVRREAYTGAGQYDVAANGTLVYVGGANASVGRFVAVDRDGKLTTLGVEPASFLRFDLTRDGRKLAAVVDGVREQELRIYDLTGGPQQVWLRHGVIGEPLWTPDSERLLVAYGDVDTRTYTTVLGSPDLTARPETVFEGTLAPPEFVTYRSDSLVVGYLFDPGSSTLIANLAADPPTLDSVLTNAVFSTLSPDGRWLAYQPPDLSQLLVSPYPDLDRRYLVLASGTGGGEPQWLADGTLVYWECCYAWYRVRIGSSPAGPVGRPELWYRDPNFSDTPGQSYTLTGDGRLVYVRGPERTPATYIRVVPHWIEQMKRIVDEANR
jgi:DNA-binding beta-propeller fold protein YncE